MTIVEADRLDIQAFVDGVVDGSLTDSEVETWMRRVFEEGMSAEDTTKLTHAMLHSGTVLQWPDEWSHLVVDKHSTGGVGDKISIPLAPALAACGLKNPMIAGRGLAFTGGTIDKMESIPGYNPYLEPEEAIHQVSEIGCMIACQTDLIAPADKRMYAIRDVTGLVASVPLITGSIVSKKAAEGLSALVMDLKVGRATFMKTIEDGRALANSIKAVGEGLGISTVVTLTEMDTPIGYAVGNSLEILESVETLMGNGPEDLVELVCVQGGHLLAETGLANDANHGAELIAKSLSNGSAMSKFKQMCLAQGAEPSVFESEHSLLSGLGLLDPDLNTTEVRANKSGIIQTMDALAVGMVSFELGAGRANLDDDLDLQVGILLSKKVGDQVEQGEAWATVYHRSNLSNKHLEELSSAIDIGSDKKETFSRIIETA